MERVETTMALSEQNFDEEKKMQNIIKADYAFSENFKKEWNEITATLRQIYEAEKLKREMEQQNKINSISVTSSSKIFI